MKLGVADTKRSWGWRKKTQNGAAGGGRKNELGVAEENTKWSSGWRTQKGAGGGGYKKEVGEADGNTQSGPGGGGLKCKKWFTDSDKIHAIII